MPAKVTIRGGPETARALQLLGRKSSEVKVLRAALRPGARQIANMARSRAPRDTGALRRSIAVGIVKTPGRSAKLVVGHRRDQAEGRWRISHIIEFGSRFVSARPYMGPAAQAAAHGVITAFGATIWQLIAKEATRVASRAALRRRRR